MKIVRLLTALGMCLVMLFANRSPISAQESVQPSEEPARSAPERKGGIPRSEVLPEDGDNQEGSEEGMPRSRVAPGDRRVAPQWLPPDRHRWKLGVHAFNTDTGVVVTQVLPDSPARRAGMERGDRIIAIGGFQVGWIENQLYPLGAELQRQASPNGRVKLLVQNVRDQSLLNLDVMLDSRFGWRGGIGDPRAVPPVHMPRPVQP